MTNYESLIEALVRLVDDFDDAELNAYTVVINLKDEAVCGGIDISDAAYSELLTKAQNVIEDATKIQTYHSGWIPTLDAIIAKMDELDDAAND